MWKSIVLAVLLALFTCGAALAAPSVCTLTGPVYDPTGAPLPNASINFDSVRTQVIGGVSIGRIVKSINTDASGNLGPNQWTQMLVVSITICDQYGNCGAPFSAIIPNTATAAFGNMIMGAFITMTIPPSSASGQVFGVNSGNTPEWETVSGGVGSCSFVWNSTGSYTLNCPGYAPKASPTFTGTVTMPDAATWTTAGLNNGTHLGIGQAAGPDPINITGNVNSNLEILLQNPNTGTAAQAYYRAYNNAPDSATFGINGTNFVPNTTIGMFEQPDSAMVFSQGTNGINIATMLNGSTTAGGPINFWIANTKVGFFNSSGLHLTNPLEIASGGRGSATAPTAGQFDVAQSATAFSAVTMSGDATLNASGAVTVSKISGVTYGGGGTAGQVLIAQSATAYAPETINGDVNVISPTGVTTVTGLHFGAQAVPLASAAVAPPANSIPYFNGTGMAVSAALTTNMPIIVTGTGPASATVSGNTTKFGTTAGTLIANDCVKFDANGNLVDAGGQCGISGGPSFPNGSPPQITGYSAANVSEAETVSGDFTFARGGLNSYVATVTKLNGTVPGGSCAANAYVSSLSSSAVPTCGAALNTIYAPIASPTFTGTVTFPDSSTITSTGHNNPKFTGTMNFPDGSTYTSAGHNNMLALGIGVAAQTGGTLLQAEKDQNANTSVLIANKTAGANAAATLYFYNDKQAVTGSYGAVEMVSSTFTAAGPAMPGDAMGILTAGAGGMVLSSAVANTAITFVVNNGNILNLGYAGGPQLSFAGTGTNALGQMAISTGNFVLAQGAYSDGTNWHATNATVVMENLSNASGNIAFYNGLGMTVGATFTPTVIAQIVRNSSGVSDITLSGFPGNGAATALYQYNDAASGSVYDALQVYSTTFNAGNSSWQQPNTMSLALVGGGGTSAAGAINIASLSAGGGISLWDGTGPGFTAKFHNSPTMAGLSLPGYGGYGGNQLTGFQIGDAYMTATNFAQVYIHGASQFYSGGWYSDGGAGSGVAMISVGPGPHIYFYSAPAMAGGVNFTWNALASWSNGLNIRHIVNLGQGEKPTVSSGQLTERSRDMTGRIKNITGSKTTITFGTPYDGGADCALIDSGKSYTWYEIKADENSATFACWDHDNKAPCPDGQNVIYLCFGAGGTEAVPDPMPGAKVPGATPTTIPPTGSIPGWVAPQDRPTSTGKNWLGPGPTSTSTPSITGASQPTLMLPTR